MEEYDERYLVVFQSYNQAMLLYSDLLVRGCKIELITTPCRISRGCSQSVAFAASDAKTVIESAKSSKIIIKGIYRIVKNNGFNNYIPI